MPHNMHEIHPEHPLSEPQIPRSGKSAIRPSGGLLSERRLAYFLSGAPTETERGKTGQTASWIFLSSAALFGKDLA
jgi:hypothetical protein